MDVSQFPKYQIYLDLLTKRDQGLMLVFVVAAIGAVWLINTRFLIPLPRLQSLVRSTIPVIFYISLLVFISGMIR